jgi:hypothetical protein
MRSSADGAAFLWSSPTGGMRPERPRDTSVRRLQIPSTPLRHAQGKYEHPTDSRQRTSRRWPRRCWWPWCACWCAASTGGRPPRRGAATPAARPRRPRRCLLTEHPTHPERSGGGRQPDRHARLLGVGEHGRARDEPPDVAARHRVGDDADRGVGHQPVACCSPSPAPSRVQSPGLALRSR